MRARERKKGGEKVGVYVKEKKERISNITDNLYVEVVNKLRKRENLKKKR